MPTRLNDIETSFRLRVDDALKPLDQLAKRIEFLEGVIVGMVEELSNISKAGGKAFKPIADSATEAGKAFNSTAFGIDLFAAKLKEADEAAKEQSRNLAQLGSDLNFIGVRLSAIGAAGTAFFGFAIKGAREEQEQLNQLRATVEATGASFEAQRPRIDAFVDGLTQVTKFADDEIRPALNRAVLATNDLDKGMRAAELGTKIAAAGFGDLEGNASLIARLFEGQVGAIGRLIPEFRDFEERIKAGASEASLAAEALARLQEVADGLTPPDNINLITKSINEIREASGQAVLVGLAPLLGSLLEVTRAAEQFAQTDFGQTAAQIGAIGSAAALALGGITIFVGQVITGFEKIKRVVTPLVAIIGAGGLAGAFIILGTAIAGASIFMEEFSKAADKARDKLFMGDRVTLFTTSIKALEATIQKLDAGLISANQAQKEFNKWGVANREEADKRVIVLKRIVGQLTGQSDAEKKLNETARDGLAVTRESILLAEKLAEARLQAQSERTQTEAGLGQISGVDAAKQEAKIGQQRIAIRIDTLQKLLAFEIDFAKRQGDEDVGAQKQTADRIASLRVELQAAQIAAATAGLKSEADIIQKTLDLQKAANADFVDLENARQQADEAALAGRVQLGEKAESDLTELLITHLKERSDFEKADINQRLNTLTAAGLAESKLAEDLNADLIKIDLAAQAERSSLEATLASQRRSEAVALAQIDRELRRVLLVDTEKDVQAARLAEIDLAHEEERERLTELLGGNVELYEQYTEALAALDAKRQRDRAEIINADIALEQQLNDATRNAILGLATLSANFAVDLVSGVENAQKAARKFFQQLISDLARAIARALILRAIIGAVGGPTSFVGKLLTGTPFQDPHADQMARFEGSRFADLFFQGMFREFNTSQERLESALTQNREINRSNSKSMTAIVNEATPETTVEFTDRHVEPRVRQRARQRSSRGVLTDAERDRQIESINERLDGLATT